MGLPGSQRRTLTTLEGRLTDSDPRLAALFHTFTRLAEDEVMPWVEEIRARPVVDRFARITAGCRRVGSRPAARVRALILLPAVMLTMLCGVMIAAGFPGAHRATPGARPAANTELVIKPHRMCRLGSIRIPAFAC